MNLKSVKSKEYVKQKETNKQKIITTESNKKLEDTGERKNEKSSETNIKNNKNSGQDISDEVELLIHQTAKKIQKTMKSKEKRCDSTKPRDIS